MIYLDHNATTPIAPEVLEAMMPYLTSEWGNPPSSYKFGAKLKGVIEAAQEQVAELIGAHASEIIFTSCGTESNNTAIYAALQATGKRHIVTPAVEHSSELRLGVGRNGWPSRPRFPNLFGAPAGRKPARRLCQVGAALGRKVSSELDQRKPFWTLRNAPN